MTLQLGGTALLLHMDGEEGSTTFTDRSPAPKVVRPQGNARISTAQSKFGGASAYFDGNGDYLEITHDPSFSFGANDFCVEAWVYPQPGGAANQCVVAKYNIGAGTRSWALRINSARVFEALCSTTGSSLNIELNSAVTVVNDQWTHLALSRRGSAFRFFVDGVLRASLTEGRALYDESNPVNIGRDSGGAWWFSGYIEEVRIVHGRSVYTADFTPPTAPLEIIPPLQINVAQKGEYFLGRGSAHFDARTVFQPKTIDLRDRAPFGLPVTPAETRGTYAELRPWQFKGRGRIAGTVKEKSSPIDKPVARRVRLYREPDGLLVRATWSDPVTGAYEFFGIPADTRYTVVSHDYAGLYRAVLADNLAPESIP